jgi:sugar O-acyltransferase (sialic acid O-acetyltransferase NeuD family)
VNKVILAGNAITAEIIYSYLKNDKRYEIVATTVDDEYVEHNRLQNIPCIGISNLMTNYKPDEVGIIMAMGYNDLNRVRESFYNRLHDDGYEILTYIHEDAQVYTENSIGKGVVILPGAVIEPHVTVGNNTMIWCNSTLAHHSIVEENCWIATGTVLSGQAKINRNSFVGVNATIVNEVEVGAFNIIGAAALISKNTKPNTVHLSRTAEIFRCSAEEYIKFFGV